MIYTHSDKSCFGCISFPGEDKIEFDPEYKDMKFHCDETDDWIYFTSYPLPDTSGCYFRKAKKNKIAEKFDPYEEG